MILKYIIPLLYTHKYNRKGLDGLAYFLEYYAFILIFTYLRSYSIVECLIVFILLLAYMSIYEVGYIENNVFSIEKDISPTIRHSEDEILFLRKNYTTIFLYRYFISIIIVFALYFYIDTFFFLVLLVLTRIVFYGYNFVYRTGIENRILFSLLRFLRFFSPIYLLGFVSFVVVLPIVLVNFINNYAWYDRTSFTLSRFFGTKLFDSISYLLFFFIFSNLGFGNISYIFIYLSIIKFFLFLIVLAKRYRLNISHFF